MCRNYNMFWWNCSIVFSFYRKQETYNLHFNMIETRVWANYFTLYISKYGITLDSDTPIIPSTCIDLSLMNTYGILFICYEA